MDAQNVLAERFEEHRARLHHLAYRMLGSDSDADDAVQETWLRLARTGTDGIDNLGAWLTTVNARVCLNLLRARATRGESTYDDEFSEPIVESAQARDPEAAAQLSDAVEAALLLVLDSLSPSERVAFVLHDTFDVPFEQIGELLGRSPEATRQLASRARRRVRAQADGGGPARRGGRPLVDAFFAAAREGDFDALIATLAPDAVLHVDDGGSVASVIRGAAQIASRALMFASPGADLRPVLVDGQPGVLVVVAGRGVSLMAFRVEGGRICAIDAYAGPERVSRITLPA
jgi:RNA polymerase sigma factor (sigma-70 family)